MTIVHSARLVQCIERCAQPREDVVCGWYGSVTQQRRFSSWPSSSFLRALQPIQSLHDYRLLRVIFPRPESWMSGQKLDILFWLFKEAPRFLRISSLVDSISADFHSQILCGFFFPVLILQVEEPSMLLRTSLHKGDLARSDPSEFSTTVHECGASTFHISIFPTSHYVASSIGCWL